MPNEPSGDLPPKQLDNKVEHKPEVTTPRVPAEGELTVKAESPSTASEQAAIRRELAQTTATIPDEVQLSSNNGGEPQETEKKREVAEAYRTAHQFGELAKEYETLGISFSWDDMMRAMDGIDKNNIHFFMTETGQLIGKIGFKDRLSRINTSTYINQTLAGTYGIEQLLTPAGLKPKPNELILDGYGPELQDALGRAEQAFAAQDLLKDLLERVRAQELTIDEASDIFGNLFQRTVGHVKQSGVLEEDSKLSESFKDKYNSQINLMTTELTEDVADTKLLFSGFGTSVIGDAIRARIKKELEKANEVDEARKQNKPEDEIRRLEVQAPLSLPQHQNLRRQLTEGPWPTQLKHRTTAERNIKFKPKKGTGPGDIAISSQTPGDHVKAGFQEELGDYVTGITSKPARTAAVVATGGGLPLVEGAVAVLEGLGHAAQWPMLKARYRGKPNLALMEGFRNGLRGYGPIKEALLKYAIYG